MSHRGWKILAAVVLVVLVLIALAWAIFGVEQISLTQSAIQARIDAKMPMKKSLGAVSNAKIDLSNNKINLAFDPSTSIIGREYMAHATTIGTLRYNKLEGSFYFIPEELSLTKFRRVGKADGTEEEEESKPGSPSKTFAFFKPAIQKAAAMAFEHIPVYSLKNDFKGIVIRAVLDRVEVKDGTIIAHLTFMQLSMTVGILAIVLTILICYLVHVIRHPEVLAEQLASELV